MSSRQPRFLRTALGALVLLGAAALACAQPAPASPPDRFAVAGVSEPQAADFLKRLQEAVRKDDTDAIAAMTSFPLVVNGAPGPKDGAQLRGQYLAIFNERVRNQILRERPSDLFVNDRGVMIGAGALWFSPHCAEPPAMPGRCTGSRQVKVIAINNTTLKAETLR